MTFIKKILLGLIPLSFTVIGEMIKGKVESKIDKKD